MGYRLGKHRFPGPNSLHILYVLWTSMLLLIETVFEAPNNL